MTNSEVIQQKKNEALNSIRKLYHPLNRNWYDEYDREDSMREQREFAIRNIIESLEKELTNLKTK